MEEKKELTQRKIYQDAVTMRHILSGYPSFFHMMEKREAGMCTITYEEAENTCELIKLVTQEDVTPAELIGRKEGYMNQSIEHYEELQRFLEAFDDCTKGTLLAFYNHIYHDFISVHFAMGGYLLYPSFLLAFQHYVEGGCKGYQDFKASVCEFDILNKTTRPVDTRFFRRDMIKLCGVYHEIWRKRQKRMEKRIQTSIHQSIEQGGL